MSAVGDTPWVPAEWMEPYLDCMGGRAEVVLLLSGPRAAIQVNAPLALYQQGTEAMLTLLFALRSKGLLRDPRGVV